MKCCKEDMVSEGAERLRCNKCGVRPRITGMLKRYEKALNQSIGDYGKAAKLLKIPLSDFIANVKELSIDLHHREVSRKQVYIITGAQTKTPVFDKFLDALEVCAEYYDAEIIVIPMRYRNPTSIFSDDDKSVWWDKRLIPYLCDSRIDIGDNLVLMSDVKTLPTASDPLSGFDELSGRKSAIYGHTSLMLKTVPVATGEMPKIICTTGAVTKRNYTDSKAGKKGEFHHVHSAQIVEVDKNGGFHIRQLNACLDGSFIDLDCEFTPDGVYTAGPCAVVLGDWHDHARSEEVEKATFTDKQSLVNTLDVELLVWHDVLDFYSRNHHHRGKPFLNFAKHHAGVTDVRAELDRMFERVKKLAGGRLCVFPYSNHPAALTKWIEEADWKTDPQNAEFYLETALAMVRATEMRGHKSHTPDAFMYWGKKLLPSGVFLGPCDPYEYKGIRLDMHGHIGANGSRGGTVKTFSKLSVKTNTGHGHGPGIHHGAYRSGTSSVYDQEYVQGPSSWLNTHVVNYANGKRSLVNIINGRFRR